MHVLAERAVRYMVHDLGAERAAVVLLKGGEARPTLYAQYGFPTDNIWGEPSVHQGVLAELLDGEPTIFVMDARTHPHYRASESHRCILGTPLPLGGFLFCDHSVAGALKMDGAAKLEKYGGGFVRRTQTLQARKYRKPSETVEQIKKSRLLMGLIAFIFCVVSFMGYNFFSGPPEVILPKDVPKQEYEVTLKGRLSNFGRDSRPSKRGKFRVKFVGGGSVELVTRDLNFGSDGSYEFNVKTKMAKPPSLAVLTIKLPRFKSESIRASVVDSEAKFKVLSLARARRRRGGQSANTARSQDPEGEALKRLSRELKSKRKPKKRKPKRRKRSEESRK